MRKISAGLRGHGLRAQRADRHVRLRRRVLRRDADRVRGTPIPRRYVADRASGSRGGPTSTSTIAARSTKSRRPRLLGARPARAAAASSRSARWRSASRSASRPRPRRSASSAGRIWSSAPTAPRVRVRDARADATSARRSTAGTAGTCGSAPTLVFDAFKFFIAETEHGVVQAHAYPYDERDEHVHRRDERAHVEAAGLGDAVRWKTACRGLLSCLPKRSRATACSRTSHAGSTSSRSATGAGAPTTSCCSATRRTPLTSRSARGRSSRWRMRWRSRGRSAVRGRRGLGDFRLRGRAAPDRREHAARRAGVARVVRGDRRGTSTRSGSSSRSTC